MLGNGNTKQIETAVWLHARAPQMREMLFSYSPHNRTTDITTQGSLLYSSRAQMQMQMQMQVQTQIWIRHPLWR